VPSLQLLDRLFPLPLLAQVVDKLAAVNHARSHLGDLVKVVGLAQHVEQLGNVQLELGDAVLIVAPHALHLVANVLGRRSRVLEPFLEVGDLGLESTNKTLVSSRDLLEQLGLFAFHLAEPALSRAQVVERVVQPLLLDKLSDNLRDAHAKRTRKLLVEIGRVVHDNALDELVDELEEAYALVAFFLDEQQVAERVEQVRASLGALGAVKQRAQDLLGRAQLVELLSVLLLRQVAPVCLFLLLVLPDEAVHARVVPVLHDVQHMADVGNVELVSDGYPCAHVVGRGETLQETDHDHLYRQHDAVNTSLTQ
jgi:hypothetical protein